jgi:divalent metal cation (Fe/Co/Zn/Cd) transporter
LIETSILYVVMLSVLSFQLVSMTVSLAEFGHRHKGLRGWLSHIQSSRNFTLSWLWKEEILNLLGIAIVLAGVMLTDMTGDARYDGAASLLIGILLLVLAFALARDVRHLLIGETLSPQVHGQVTDLLEEHAAVREIIALEAVYLRPDHVLLSLVLDYDPEARAELIALLQRAVPELHQIDIAAKRG